MADEGTKERMGARQAAREAVAYLAEMTGQQPEAVVGVERGDGTWLVTVEVLELSRVPDTTDVIGSYEVGLDGAGEPVSYRRMRRYTRGSVDTHE